MPAPTKTKVKLSVLELVYPPISNQEAVWLQKVPDVEAMLRNSDFYMIAARTEAKFTHLQIDREEHVVTFNFQIGEHLSEPVRIHLRELPGIADADLKGYFVEVGEKMIRVWDGPIKGEGSDVLAWYTTESFLWDRSRGTDGIEGLDHLRELATYDLLYIGIAKKGDSFDRLFTQGHKARTDILANEPQRLPGARVTDEIYLFMFAVNPLIIQTFHPDHEFSEGDLSGEYDRKRIVADAEKAFVSLLQPGYNIVKFANYPKGADCLYGSDFARYAYIIGEEMAFNTPHGSIRGAREPNGLMTNRADGILVEGERVTLLVSGEDFPAD